MEDTEVALRDGPIDPGATWEYFGIKPDGTTSIGYATPGEVRTGFPGAVRIGRRPVGSIDPTHWRLNQ